jgi:transcriptional regulator with XRE-family HTH domain
VGYRGKGVEQERARELRSLGWTVAEIADDLGVARSSVSLWVRDVEFEPRPRQRARRRGPNVLQRRKAAEIEAFDREGIARIGQLSAKEFLVAGVALYAGEGSKTDGDVKLANSDPGLIRFFCLWLRTFFSVEESRLRVWLYLHEGLDLEAAIAFWSGLTGIPASQFGKPYRAVPDAGIRNSKHRFGCAAVSYSCSRTHRAVMGLCRALVSSSAVPG